MDDSNPMAWDPYGDIGGNQSFQVDNPIQNKKTIPATATSLFIADIQYRQPPVFLKKYCRPSVQKHGGASVSGIYLFAYMARPAKIRKTIFS